LLVTTSRVFPTTSSASLVLIIYLSHSVSILQQIGVQTIIAVKRALLTQDSPYERQTTLSGFLIYCSQDFASLTQLVLLPWNSFFLNGHSCYPFSLLPPSSRWPYIPASSGSLGWCSYKIGKSFQLYNQTFLLINSWGPEVVLVGTTSGLGQSGKKRK
jgi:hypothetical protein